MVAVPVRAVRYAAIEPQQNDPLRALLHRPPNGLVAATNHRTGSTPVMLDAEPNRRLPHEANATGQNVDLMLVCLPPNIIAAVDNFSKAG